MTKNKSLPDRNDPQGFSIRVKVWIEDENHELVMGMGRVAMLEAIERTGSLNKAAAELNMSYRALWGRLRRTEKRLGQPLLVRTTGGKQGGGSQLTPFAKSLMKKFRELDSQLTAQAKEQFTPLARELERK